MPNIALMSAPGYPPLSVVVAPSSLSESYVGSGVIPMGSLTATASGGFGGYSYLWESDNPDVVIDDPTAATINVSIDATYPLLYSGNIKCTVSDAIPLSAESDDAPVTLTPDA